MVKYSKVKNCMIVLLNAEEDGWGGELAVDAHSLIPPLGALNRDGTRASEHNNDPCVGDVDRLMSEAMLGACEMLTGKTAVNFSDSPEKQEIQDLNYNMEISRGFERYTGSLEINEIQDLYKYEGAVDGAWSPEMLAYFASQDFRKFILLTFQDPNEYSLAATSCKKLTQHFGVVLEKLDKKMENPVGLSIAISRENKYSINDWEAEVPPTLSSDAITSGANVYAGLPIPHRKTYASRLLIAGTVNVADDGKSITITGYDWNDREMSESITLEDGAQIFMTKKHFQVISSVYWAGANDITAVTIKAWDTKIQTIAPLGLTKW